MTNDISRRLLLKLAAGTGVALAIPPAVQAAVPDIKDEYPAFEYFDGDKWVELGGVFDVDLKVTVDQIWQGPGRTPIRGVVTTHMCVHYYRNSQDPFACPDIDRMDVRIRIDCLGKPHRFSCAQMQAVSYEFGSDGKVHVTLISGGFPEIAYA